MNLGLKHMLVSCASLGPFPLLGVRILAYFNSCENDPVVTEDSVPVSEMPVELQVPFWTLLFLHQVASVSSLPPLFSTQLCESLCVPDSGEHLGN